MIGLVALFFVVAAIRFAQLGWSSFKARWQSAGGGVPALIAFLGLSALLGAISFLGSAAAFEGQVIYGFTFAMLMAIINVGAPGVLSFLVRLIPGHGITLSDALRVAPAFFVIYWFSFAESITKLFYIRLSV